MSKFVAKEASIQGLYILERNPIVDERGFLERIFCHDTFENLTGFKSLRQINRTLTRKTGTVRGLHFQHQPNAEKKIVSCLKGSVWDVAVDLREGSPTFLSYEALVLSESNHLSFLIPEGFAHGFQTLESNCEMIYLHSADYEPQSEGAVNAQDPCIGISWPKLISERSQKDSVVPFLPENFRGL